jgi:tetratricopeptide (TPR) repeat protein
VTLPVIDQDGRATVLAAEAQAALSSGDTQLANQKYREAGEVLERRIGMHRKRSEQDVIRFLAATQYYKGGHYRKALSLCRQIQRNLLENQIASLFTQFSLDANERAAADYIPRVREKLLQAARTEDSGRLLSLLQDHPYVLSRDDMAFLRAAASENLGNYDAATVFFADAIRWRPDDPTLVVSAAAKAFTSPLEGPPAKVWEYTKMLVKAVPHAATLAAASFVCFRRATEATGEERRLISNEQIRYFQDAWQSYKTLPIDEANNQELSKIMHLALIAGAISLFRQGDHKRARELCDDAIEHGHDIPAIRTERGIVTYPSDESIADFQKAIELGEEHYSPNFYLAHNAIVKRDFASAEMFCRKGLQARPKPGQMVEFCLYSWLAICRKELGGTKGEVESFFLMASQISPNNPELAEIKRMLQEDQGQMGLTPGKPKDADSFIGEEFLQMQTDRARVISRAFQAVKGLHAQPV